MLELCLTIGDTEANVLDTSLLILSFSNVLQWLFFIIVAIIIAKYIKKKNANSGQN